MVSRVFSHDHRDARARAPPAIRHLRAYPAFPTPKSFVLPPLESFLNLLATNPPQSPPAPSCFPVGLTQPRPRSARRYLPRPAWVSACGSRPGRRITLCSLIMP